ncbi:hypothetical protein A2960_01775 [Candidatus Gottesmanbacteria bacterium RIFCSPLOWO2_01_FULL_39_12b]|uniref:Translation elongation factor-like protein n=1 Tax=Candidatus Gottesmanbacteria bacterium RIFCSPLOWO2_01_FULL_39_12b TaxID=1798388 RepID=A0A1F6AQ95_9BACT|nr:MAG: hypothetical protein A2960_01775 [Candidatus Gottesmanbacteria bacterium RIFCSPLOWO2_01_FULL_39_12b]
MAVKIGTITHYYDKIGVAVVKLIKPMVAGDTIKISGKGREFTQVVSSIQKEHQELKKAKKGDDIGMKVDQPVKPKDVVFKI